MKLLTIAAALMLTVSTAFADHHEKDKKKTGHDKEHAHVTSDKVDHDDAHHKDHDHKAHHPEHKEDTTKKK